MTRKFTKLFSALTLSTCLFTADASAGFMKDFYSAAGSYQGNVTPAGVYQSSGMNTVTGGGLSIELRAKISMRFISRRLLCLPAAAALTYFLAPSVFLLEKSLSLSYATSVPHFPA